MVWSVKIGVDFRLKLFIDNGEQRLWWSCSKWISIDFDYSSSFFHVINGTRFYSGSTRFTNRFDRYSNMCISSWYRFLVIPFLLLSPLSIWFVLWRRNVTSCVIAILIHFCSTLFATAILLVSFLVLIGQIGFLCSTSSFNSSYIALNSALIGIATLLKLFHYTEIILLYLLIKNKNQPSTIFIEECHGKDDLFGSEIAPVNIWRSWSTIPSETHSYFDVFFAWNKLKYLSIFVIHPQKRKRINIDFRSIVIPTWNDLSNCLDHVGQSR